MNSSVPVTVNSSHHQTGWKQQSIHQILNQSEEHKLPLFKCVLERVGSSKDRRHKRRHKRRHENAQEKYKICKKMNIEKRRRGRGHSWRCGWKSNLGKSCSMTEEHFEAIVAPTPEQRQPWKDCSPLKTHAEMRSSQKQGAPEGKQNKTATKKAGTGRKRSLHSDANLLRHPAPHQRN